VFTEWAPRFGIVPTIVHEPLSAANVSAAAGNRCISVGHKGEVSARALRALRDVGVAHVGTRSIGFDHIDVAAAARLGIAVQNVVYGPEGVADHTLMLILMVIRNARDLVRATDRHDFRLGGTRGRDLCDMTVGVVGAGHIGAAVIGRLGGFGCRVLACSTDRDPIAGAEVVPVDHLLRESDIVTLHLPLSAETHHFIGHEQIETMKQGAFLVNTARGALVDTGALLVALERGRLGGAALDVLEGEEGVFYSDCTAKPIDNPFLPRLQELPNVVVTPHTAYYTRRNLRDTVERTLLNCLDFERNRAHDEAQGRDLVRGMLRGA
jgi:D-specific alpha-keto acid dehydrogenase